jgi:hypothetical protein
MWRASRLRGCWTSAAAWAAGSIYWAQEHGSAVTGLTVTAAHLPVMAALASQAGVAARVRALHADVHQFAEDRAYDAAVAIESSGYMDRARLFSVVGRTLRRDGWFGIQDHFLCRREWAGFIDGYYRTRLGTVAEHVDAQHLHPIRRRRAQVHRRELRAHRGHSRPRQRDGPMAPAGRPRQRRPSCDLEPAEPSRPADDDMAQVTVLDQSSSSGWSSGWSAGNQTAVRACSAGGWSRKSAALIAVS